MRKTCISTGTRTWLLGIPFQCSDHSAMETCSSVNLDIIGKHRSFQGHSIFIRSNCIILLLSFSYCLIWFLSSKYYLNSIFGYVTFKIKFGRIRPWANPRPPSPTLGILWDQIFLKPMTLIYQTCESAKKNPLIKRMDATLISAKMHVINHVYIPIYGVSRNKLLKNTCLLLSFLLSCKVAD